MLRLLASLRSAMIVVLAIIVYTVEYVLSAHGRGTLGCSGRGGWAFNTYPSANGM